MSFIDGTCPLLLQLRRVTESWIFSGTAATHTKSECEIWGSNDC